MTGQELIDRARLPLNDAAKVRYADTEMLVYLRESLVLARRKRPDLFLGRYADSLAVGLADVVPLDGMYMQTLADYVTGRCETKDGDMGEEARGMLFIKLSDASL